MVRYALRRWGKAISFSPAAKRLLTMLIHRYPGEPASQNLILPVTWGSFLAKRSRNCVISAVVAAASGGGGTRKSLPEVMTQVFQLPAFGSIWPDCANAKSADKRTTVKTVPKNRPSM